LTREGESRLESHRQRKWRVRQIRRRVPRRAEERIRAQPSVGVGLTIGGLEGGLVRRTGTLVVTDPAFANWNVTV